VEVEEFPSDFESLIKHPKIRKTINRRIKEFYNCFDSKDDARQEAYICLDKAIKKFKTGRACAFHSYFSVILKNSFISIAKKKEKNKLVLLTKGFDFNRVVSDYNESTYDNFEIYDYLDKTEQFILHERFYNKKTLKNIAGYFGVTIEGMRKRICRILKKIQKTDFNTI
jgi:RNA polymerase sigma factor (sigma-70 family)